MSAPSPPQPPPPPPQQPQPGTGTTIKRRSSLESTASIVISGPAARATDGRPEPDVIEIPPQFELYDAASVIVECPKHHKFAFRKIGSKKDLWFPTAVASRINGFEASIRSKLKQLLSHPDMDTGYIPFSPLETVQYSRIQCPVVNLFVTRVIFRTYLSTAADQPCCEDTVTMEWMTAEHISELFVHRFWGPEPLLVTNKRDALPQLLKDVYMELPVSEWSKLTSADDALAQAAGYEPADVARIYADFLQHVYPSCLMSPEALTAYLIKSGMIDTDQNMPVRIRDVFWPTSEHRLCLTFSQFVAGLAAIDADNTKIPGKKGNRSFFKCDASNDRMAYPVICERFSEVTTLTKAPPDKCPKCMGHMLMIANFSCSIIPDGTLCDFIEQNLADNQPIPVFERDLQYNLCQDERWCANLMIQWIYDHAFVHKIHTGPIDLPKVRRRRDPKPISLWSIKKDELFEMIKRLCEMVRAMLMKDSRLVDMMDPCYVIGSLHGSLCHLLQLDCLFWRQGIAFEAGNYVFLGNFSGPMGHSLECLLYLFAAKCTAPAKIALIRGKAENRTPVPAFAQQLSQHFGARSIELIEKICSVFDVMPIACLINGWEVCTSGGLPDPLHSLDELNRIPLSIPAIDSHPIVKAAVNPMSLSPDLMTRMKNIHINSLTTGTSDANSSSQFSPEPVYHLSSTKDPVVVLFSDEKKTSIEIRGIDPVTVNKVQ